jgi:hypothetical protein
MNMLRPVCLCRTHKLAWQTFFCCMVSTFTTQAFNSIFRTGKLGTFSSAVRYKIAKKVTIL